MRQLRYLWCAALLLVIASTGCAKKTQQASSESAGDSLLAASPVETPQGNMTPTQNYQQQPTTPPENPPAEKPAHTTNAKPASTTPSHVAPSHSAAPSHPGVEIPAGTPIHLSIDTEMTSEKAQVGDPWTGKVTESVVLGTAAPIPAGSTVQGVVKAVKPAVKGDRAMLQLSINSIDVQGHSHAINASTEEMIAGSTRARNVSTVAGTAAAGALIGKAVGGGKGALIGGLLGAGAATGAVATTKGYQMVLKAGDTLHVTVDQAVTFKE
jgi:hypothetical protein